MTIHQFVNPRNITLHRQVFDGIDVTHTYTTPRQFILATFDLLQNGANFHSTQHERSAFAVEDVLSLFCGCVFQTEVEHPTSLWMDVETNELYLVAFTYDGGDYYSTAFSYLARVTV